MLNPSRTGTGTRQLQHHSSVPWTKLGCRCRSIRLLFLRPYRSLLFSTNSFLLQLLYFISLSSLGFWALKLLKPRTHGSFNPRSLDLFFTSASAATVSSMSTVEMEVFSNAQLIVITVLMFVGGEVFTSMVGLHLRKDRLKMLLNTDHDKVASVQIQTIPNNARSTSLPDVVDQTELGLTQKPQSFVPYDDCECSRYRSVRFLGVIVFLYLAVNHVVGIALVAIYIRSVPSAGDVLRNKGLNMLTFTVFTTVSTFASCGFVPTNESMIVFSKNSGLLLILIPQVLLGNNLFPPCLRFCLWLSGKFMNRSETSYLLKNTAEIGYLHLLPGLHSRLLVATIFGFIGIQFLLFCALQWNSDALVGLNPYQKIVGVLFECVNTRHNGETIVDLSTIAPAVLVLLVVMMYLPPYTSFLPVKDNDKDCPEAAERSSKPKIRGKIIENLVFSQLSYIAIFIIVICITEREKMKEDPINFSVLNIVFEVISAYGNVGFSTGYSCRRQLKPEPRCRDKWFGFAGKWSDQGKVVLIIVMVFGRMKKFNMNGGRGWKLL